MGFRVAFERCVKREVYEGEVCEPQVSTSAHVTARVAWFQ